MKLRNNKRILSPRRRVTEEVDEPVAAIPGQSSSENSVGAVIGGEIARIHAGAGIVASLLSTRNERNHSRQTIEIFFNRPTSDDSPVTTSTLGMTMSVPIGLRSPLFRVRTRTAESTGEDGSESEVDFFVGLEHHQFIQNNIAPTTTTLTRSEKLCQMQRMTVTKDQTKDKLCCPVCQEAFPSNRIVYTMRCGHVYHRNCILKWLDTNQRCPVCRIDLIKDDTIIDDDEDEDEDDNGDSGNVDRIRTSGISSVACP